MTRKDLIIVVLSVLLATGAVFAAGCVGQETPPQIIDDTIPQEAFAATQENYVFMVYFTGIGYRYCERVTPMVLEQLPREYANLVIIEYETQENEQNAKKFNRSHTRAIPRGLLAFREALSM